MSTVFGENITYSFLYMQKYLSKIHMISSTNAICKTVSQAVIPLCSNKEVYMLAASRSEKGNRESMATVFNRFRIVRVERTENFRVNKAESVSYHGTPAHNLQVSSRNCNHCLK
jgi:hypothetical protein